MRPCGAHGSGPGRQKRRYCLCASRRCPLRRWLPSNTTARPQKDCCCGIASAIARQMATGPTSVTTSASIHLGARRRAPERLCAGSRRPALRIRQMRMPRSSWTHPRRTSRRSTRLIASHRRLDFASSLANVCGQTRHSRRMPILFFFKRSADPRKVADPLHQPRRCFT